jgi:hypothetical protein
MMGKSLTFFGMSIFLAGLTWFAHFSFSRSSYILSFVVMGVGILVAFAGATRRREILFSMRQYFRRR